MIWQDWLICIGCFVLAVSMIPSVTGKEKPPRITCGIMASVLLSFAVAFGTLDLWLSLAGAMSQVTMWTILLFQGRGK